MMWYEWLLTIFRDYHGNLFTIITISMYTTGISFCVMDYNCFLQRVVGTCIPVQRYSERDVCQFLQHPDNIAVLLEATLSEGMTLSGLQPQTLLHVQIKFLVDTYNVDTETTMRQDTNSSMVSSFSSIYNTHVNMYDFLLVI